MKILALGDPHGKLPKKIPKNINLILITGDLGKSDIWRKIAFDNLERKKKGLEIIRNKNQIKRGYYEWFNSCVKVLKILEKIAPVYFVSGNIEKTNKETRELEKEIGEKLPFLSKVISKLRVKKLDNKKINFNKIKICGIPYYSDNDWMKRFEPIRKKERGKEYKKETEKEKRILNWFGKQDILISHIPPYGILDIVGEKAPKSWRGKHAGSKILLNYIKKHQLKFFLCGHIHEGKGEVIVGKTRVINLGCCGDFKVIELY